MNRMFKQLTLGEMTLRNRFVFPPVKTAFGTPQGNVTNRQILFYKKIAKNGPGIVILEPVSVTSDGKEHPKQLCIHLPNSVEELKKIIYAIHEENRLICLHLNHAGASANPKATGTPPKAPSAMKCPSKEQAAEALTEEEIRTIIAGYKSAAEKAIAAGVDILEIQGGHGYLISQFLNGKLNKRSDPYGQDRLLFAKHVLTAVREGAPAIPLILRISGDEMSPEFGIDREDLKPLISLAQENGIAAIHVGMGNTCFSPPWYFHHTSLPEKPQIDAISWLRKQTTLPLIIAGRMGRKEKVQNFLDQGLADFVALGRPLIADPELVEKWQNEQDDDAIYCGYCLQGCLQRLQNGNPLGCNLNPEIGEKPLEHSNSPRTVLIAGGGPAGISAALYLNRRGHKVTLAEKDDHLGGQFVLAWQAPGKEKMKAGLDRMIHSLEKSDTSILLHKACNAELIREIQPDLFVWATGAVQNIPEINGLETQWTLTSIEYFNRNKEVRGKRILVIGAGRAGLEIAEKLGIKGFDVVATKRTDPIGSFMEKITRTLTLKRIGNMSNVILMPHTTVISFKADGVEMEQDGKKVFMEPFNTVILASGMLSSPEPDKKITSAITDVEIIGDANKVQDIFTAVHAGYELACKY